MRIAALIGLLALALAAPAQAQVPSGNLLINPGGDAAAGGDGTTTVAVPGWAIEGQFTTVVYGSPDFLTTDDSAKWSGGANFFAGGIDGDSNAATQIVDVSAGAAQIDTGKESMTLSGLLGGFSSQTDSMTVTATAMNAAGALVATATLAPVTPDDRQQQTTLIARTATVALPAGTRSIAVRMVSTRVEGQYNDGYADNLSLVVGTGGTPVFHKSVVLSGISGTVLVKKPGSSTFTKVSADSGIPLGSTVDTRKGRVTLTSVPKAGGQPESAEFYDGIFKVTQVGNVTNLTLTETLAPCGKKAERGREEAQDTPALGQRQGQLPHDRQVQRGHDPRHEMARGGHLLGHLHKGHAGVGERARQRQAQDDPGARAA